MSQFAIETTCKNWFDIPTEVNYLEFDRSEIELVKLREQQISNIVYLSDGLLVLDAYDLVEQKYLSHSIDVEGFVKQQGKSFPASKKNLFAQAIGRKTKTVLDATGGWLGDSMLMCSQGFQVFVMERFWLLQGFIQFACQQWRNNHWVNINQASVPQLIEGDSIELIKHNSINVDCIYIDPMFPAKIKKSAETRKSMRLLQGLLGEDFDAKQLFSAAWQSNSRRIVVKRPDYADTLSGCIKPTETLAGKLVRYDVYLR